MVITPKESKPYFETGDIFNCAAESNPKCSFTWDVISGSTSDLITNEAKMEVAPSMGGWYNISCEAENQMIGGSSTVKRATTFTKFHVGGKVNSR